MVLRSRRRLTVSPISANDFGPPDVAALDGGGFAIVWHDNRTTGGGDVSGSGVHLRAYDAAGAPLGTDRLVNGATAGNQADSSITALHDGHYVVTWTDLGPPGPARAGLIKGRMLDAAGAPLGSEFVVSASASHDELARILGDAPRQRQFCRGMGTG